MTSPLHLKARAGTGLIHRVTPESAGWTYVGFELHRLRAGQPLAGSTGARELCLVFISGRGRVSAGGHEFGAIGERMSPFEGPPWSLYVPAASAFELLAETDCEIALCFAPGVAGARPPRLIPPGDAERLTRGTGSNTRYPTNILPETAPADSLLIIEVITPAGHASSYPPHKHDVDDLPRESLLEETYYHRLSPGQGFAFQRVYTDDRSLDEAIAIEDGDVVMVPRGYHPCAALHGYDLYYLNVMAGPRRTWRYHNAAEHEWMLEGVPQPKSEAIARP